MAAKNKTDLDDLQAALRAEYEDAKNYHDEDLSPFRQEAQAALDGDDLKGDDDLREENRSTVKMRTVADSHNAIMPSLLRIFLGNERVGEFNPRGPEDVAAAQQMTDYVVDIVIGQDNPAYLLLHTATKDSLTFGIGMLKAYWDNSRRVTERRYTGLTMAQVQAFFANDPEVEIVEATFNGASDPSMLDPNMLPPMLAPHVPKPDPNGMLGFMPPFDVTVDLRIRRKPLTGRVKIIALKPEEFLIDRHARSTGEARYTAQRMVRTVSDLVAEGYDLDEIEEHAGSYPTLEPFSTGLEAVRNPSSQTLGGGSENTDPSQQYVLYGEHYFTFDSDGDGIEELHKVCTIGDTCHVLHDEIVDDNPFVPFLCMPRPHQAIGDSLSDQTIDMQIIQTNVMRHSLDSLARAIHPQLAIDENIVNDFDATHQEPGGVIRVNGQPGSSVTPITQTWVGAQALQMQDYLDGIVERRIGVRQAASLDPDALQSQTKAGVQFSISAAQERVEMLARTLAETGYKTLMLKVLKLVMQHQDKPRVVRLRGQWVEVDPRTWDAALDVVINVALGRGDDQNRIGILTQLLGAIKEVMAITKDPMNPLGGLRQWRRVWSDIAAIAGIKDLSPYIGAVDGPKVAEMIQKMQQPGPNPEMMLAQAEAAKADAAKMQAEAQVINAKTKVEFEREQMRLEDERERLKMDMEFALKLAELQIKAGAQIDVARIKADVDRTRHREGELNTFLQHVIPVGAAGQPEPEPDDDIAQMTLDQIIESHGLQPLPPEQGAVQ